MNNIYTRLHENVKKNNIGNNVALVIAERDYKFTYNDLLGFIDRYFENHRIPNTMNGGIILNLNGNTIDSICLMYAAIKNNMVVINTTEKGSIQILENYPVNIVIGSGGDQNKVDILPQKATHTFPKNIPATILFTSGSSGIPKGVCHSHTGMLAAIDSINQYLNNVISTRVITKLPLHHGYGLYQVLSILDCGGTVILEPENVMMSKLICDMQQYNATDFPIVPSMAPMLFNDTSFVDALCRLSTITSASSQMPQKYIDFIHQHLPDTNYITMYGQTECVRALWLDPKYKDIAPYATGKPIPGVFAFLVDEKNNLTCEGELIIMGDNVMDGYFNDTELSSKVFVNDDGNVLLYTGDIFRVDDNGLYYYISRKDDIIKINDERVSLNQLDAIAISVDGVSEAVSCYVNNKFILHVVKEDDVSLNEIKKQYATRMGRNFVPETIYVYTELPKNSNGKYDRKFLSNISLES